jgi:hypothetical protein
MVLSVVRTLIHLPFRWHLYEYTSNSNTTSRCRLPPSRNAVCLLFVEIPPAGLNETIALSACDNFFSTDMSTTNIYSGADSRRYTASPSPDTAAATAQIILSVLAGLCGIYIALDYYGFPVRFWLQVALSMAWGGFVDLVPERLLFALDPSSNPCSVNADADTELKKPANMQAAKSEVLRKAFRLDGLGFFKSAKGDGPLRGISKLMKASPSDAPPGLGNWDNSCYQNSVIQVCT